MVRKLTAVILLCLVIFWSGRIYSVNRTQGQDDICYEAADIVEYQGVQLRLEEAYIYDIDEFQEKYDVRIDYMGSGNRVICACFEVTNHGESDMPWDDVLESTMCGFQSDTWASAVSPVISTQINVFSSDYLAAGATQRVWYVTTMMEESFKHKTWENMQPSDFCYVFSYAPEKIMVKLDL